MMPTHDALCRGDPCGRPFHGRVRTWPCMTLGGHKATPLQRALHNPNLLIRKGVKLVDELVNLAVGGGDLALQDGFFLR